MVSRGRKVLVSGFFDPVHRGHIAYFREAKKLGDWLVVATHRDQCCVKKRGACFMPLEDRIAVLEAIRYVDEVVVCEPGCDLTSCSFLLRVRPDIFAKGNELYGMRRVSPPNQQTPLTSPKNLSETGKEKLVG